MIVNKFLKIINQPPWQDYQGHEDQEFVLTCACLDQPVDLLFLGQGVLQLLDSQDSTTLMRKNYIKSMQAYPDYEIDTIYVEQESITYFKLKQTDLILPFTLVNQAALNELFNQYQHVFS